MLGLVLANINMLIVGLALIGLIVVAYSLRKQTRSIVYSYTLEHGLYLPRLTDEPNLEIIAVEGGWELHSKKYKKIGYVTKRKVNWLVYQIAYFLWGWVDDDCDRDTVPIGYGIDILSGKHFPSAPKWFKDRVRKEQGYLETQVSGNAFHLGETLEPNWVPVLSIMWMFRNLAYNFNYSQEEIREYDNNNFYYLTKREYPHLEKNDLTQKWEVVWTKWHWGYIPYTNSTRKGRLVFLWEDIDKLDQNS